MKYEFKYESHFNLKKKEEEMASDNALLFAGFLSGLTCIGLVAFTLYEVISSFHLAFIQYRCLELPFWFILIRDLKVVIIFGSMP